MTDPRQYPISPAPDEDPRFTFGLAKDIADAIWATHRDVYDLPRLAPSPVPANASTQALPQRPALVLLVTVDARQQYRGSRMRSRFRCGARRRGNCALSGRVR